MRGFMTLVMVVATFAAWAQEQPTSEPKLLRSQELVIEVEPEALQRQYLALQAMRLDSVEYSQLGSVKRLVGDTGLTLPSQASELRAGDSAGAVLQLLKDLLLAKGTETLVVTRHDEIGYKADPSTRGLRLAQEIRGVPVVNSFIGISYSDASKEISKIVSVFVPDRGLAREAKVSAIRAEQVVPEAHAAMKESDSTQIEILEGTHLAYYHEPPDPTPPRLVWVVHAQLGAGSQWIYYVDAVSGTLIVRVPVSQSLTTKLYNADGAAWAIPGQVPSQSMTNAQIAANPMAQEAKNYVLDADSKLRLRFPLPSAAFPTQTRQIIKYGYSSPNAEHILNGSHDYILYSGPYSGPQAPRNSSTKPSDITYHEYTHGIGRRLLPVIPDPFIDFQWGAIQEAFADIGASAVQIGVAGVPSSASWQMGEGWFVASPNAPTRSMSNPATGTPPYAPNADWYPMRLMGGYAHYNSTILSHAYYLSIYGGLNAQWLKLHIPEITVPSLDPIPTTAENYARQIFVRAIDDDDVAGEVTMFAIKQAAMDQASALYPLLPARRTSIQKAFEAVGVGYQCSSEPGVVTPSIFDLQCNGRFSINWPDIPGGDRYVVVIAPVLYGWSFGQIATDGFEATHCMAQVGQYSMLRMRACNNCGCGPWSQTQYLNYSPGPCP